MRRTAANNERALSPTAPRRRAEPQTSAPAELNPSSSLSRVLRQRELANAARTGNSRSSRQRRSEPVVAEASARRIRPVAAQVVIRPAGGLHPLSNGQANAALRAYEERTLGAFDRIVPVLKRISALQHEADFINQAQRVAQAELGHELPLPVLETAWTSQLDMRTLFAWCVFEAYEQTSLAFFNDDPLAAQDGSSDAETFNAFLLECGFHLLDITPCADGRLAHAIAYALRLPYSSVRRRSHAGAMFDVENTVDRWVKTEHRLGELVAQFSQGQTLCLGHEIGFVLQRGKALQHRHDVVEGTEGALFVGPQRCVGLPVGEWVQTAGGGGFDHHLGGHRPNPASGAGAGWSHHRRSCLHAAAARLAGASGVGQFALAQHFAERGGGIQLSRVRA